jgi:hypothetical protein
VLALKVSGPLVILNVEATGKVPKHIFGKIQKKVTSEYIVFIHQKDFFAGSLSRETNKMYQN